MFGSTAIDVAIGLVLIYFLLAVLVSTLNEFIAAAGEWRAKNLEIGLNTLLKGNDAGGTALITSFYEHGLVRSMYTRRFFQAGPNPGGKKPSYIPARIFARALEDILLPANPAAPPRTLAQLRQSVSTLPEGPTRQAISALLEEAGTEINDARAAIEHWFDDAMDRMSGWYKRQVQVVILALSLAIALALNADTLTIGNTLVHNPEARAFVVATAERVAQATPPPTKASPEPSFAKVADALKEVGDLQLPLGWKNGWTDVAAVLPWANFQSFLLKISGLAITAVAVSFGAPFWFDLLSKLVSLRTAIKPPKADEQATK
jgi:hypothetical protein